MAQPASRWLTRFQTQAVLEEPAGLLTDGVEPGVEAASLVVSRCGFGGNGISISTLGQVDKAKLL